MADTPRTQDAINQDPSALRRRARRRLVGAVAIALTAVVVVPMLFDPDPKPLGSDVEIRIPAQETPFEPSVPQGPKVESPAAAMEAGGGPSEGPAAPGEPAIQAEPTPTSPPPISKPAPVPAPAPTEAKTPQAKPQAQGKPVVKPEPKPVPKPAPKAEAKPESKPDPAPEPAFASKGYYLQLGAFGSAANAEKLKAKAAAAGFKVDIADGNGQYRVRVGPIPERDKALDALARLKSKGFSPVMIGP